MALLANLTKKLHIRYIISMYVYGYHMQIFGSRTLYVYFCMAYSLPTRKVIGYKKVNTGSPRPPPPIPLYLRTLGPHVELVGIKSRRSNTVIYCTLSLSRTHARRHERNQASIRTYAYTHRNRYTNLFRMYIRLAFRRSRVRTTDSAKHSFVEICHEII